MAIDIDNIFSNEDKAKVMEGIQDLANCEEAIRRGETAGFNMDAVKERCKNVKERLRKFKQGFFPNS